MFPPATSVRDFKERFLGINPDTPDDQSVSAVLARHQRISSTQGDIIHDQPISSTTRTLAASVHPYSEDGLQTMKAGVEADNSYHTKQRPDVELLRKAVLEAFRHEGWPDFIWEALTVRQWPTATLSRKGFKIYVEGFGFHRKGQTKTWAHQGVQTMQKILQDVVNCPGLQSCQLRRKNHPTAIQFIFDSRPEAQLFAEAMHQVRHHNLHTIDAC